MYLHILTKNGFVILLVYMDFKTYLKRYSGRGTEGLALTAKY